MCQNVLLHAFFLFPFTLPPSSTDFGFLLFILTVSSLYRIVSFAFFTVFLPFLIFSSSMGTGRCTCPRREEGCFLTLGPKVISTEWTAKGPQWTDLGDSWAEHRRSRTGQRYTSRWSWTLSAPAPPSCSSPCGRRPWNSQNLPTRQDYAKLTSIFILAIRTGTVLRSFLDKTYNDNTYKDKTKTYSYKTYKNKTYKYKTYKETNV